MWFANIAWACCRGFSCNRAFESFDRQIISQGIFLKYRNKNWDWQFDEKVQSIANNLKCSKNSSKACATLISAKEFANVDTIKSSSFLCKKGKIFFDIKNIFFQQKLSKKFKVKIFHSKSWKVNEKELKCKKN